MSAPSQLNNNNNKPITVEQMLVKMILDGQTNISKLISMQEQQMIYINMLIKNVNNNNESIPSTQSESSAVQTQSGTINSTEEQGQPINNKSITEKDKTI